MLSEIDVLGFFINNPKDYAEHKGKIGSSFWELDHCKLIWDWAGYFWSKEKKPPNWGQMRWAATQDKRILDENIRQFVLDQIDLVYDKNLDWELEPLDREQLCIHLLQRENDSFRHSVETRNFIEYGRLLDDYKKQEALIEDIRKPKKERDQQEFYGQIMAPFSNQELLVAWEDLQSLRKNALSTGYPELDWILEGGLREGELSVIHGRSGDCKSLILMAIALNVLRSNDWTRVLVIAADNTRKEMYSRLRANVSKLPLGIGADYDEKLYLDRLQRNIGPRWDSRFKMVRWARGKHTTAELWDIIGAIEEQEKESDLAAGIPPELAGKVHLVVPDYIGVIQGAGRYGPDSRRHEVDDVVKDLAAIGEERDRHVLTGHQSNRSGKFAEQLSDEHASEHYGVLFHSSLFFNIDRNKADRACRRLRLFASKARRTFSNYKVGFTVNTSTMSLDYDSATGIVNEDGTTFHEWARWRQAAKLVEREDAAEKPQHKPTKQHKIVAKPEAEKLTEVRFNPVTGVILPDIPTLILPNTPPTYSKPKGDTYR